MSEEKNTMAAERSLGDFSSESLGHYIFGSKRQYESFHTHLSWMEKELLPLKPVSIGISDWEHRKGTMKQATKVLARLSELSLSHEEILMFNSALDFFDRSLNVRLVVHRGVFVETLKVQGTDEQSKQWLEDAAKGKIYGCFAMTELAHSSFIRGAETEATYDSATDSFIINSTSLLATKWWIGAAGEVATHAVVLVNVKRSAGPCWFFIQLRDVNTGELCEGIDAGYVGPRIGRPGIDNGFVRFNNVRVPRSQLLSRFLDISKEGNVTHKKGSAGHMAYNALIAERLWNVIDGVSGFSQAAIIALRYTLVRRQGPQNEQIIDYSIQPETLLPILISSMMAFRCYVETLPRWHAIRAQNPDPIIVNDWHAVAASCKAFWTWYGMDSIELCRRSLGGHAFSALNAIGGLWCDSTAMTSGGGDNYVLSQQGARHLIKSFRTASSTSGEKIRLGPSVSYFTTIKPGTRIESIFQSESDAKTAITDSQAQIKLLFTLQRALRMSIINHLAQVSSDIKTEEDWNIQMNYLIYLSNMHAFDHTFNINLGCVANSAVPPIVPSIMLLWVLKHAVTHSSTLIEYGGISATQMQYLRHQFKAQSRKLRKNAALLVDSWALPDWIIKAPFGRQDGDIYAPYMEMVRRANANKGPSYWKETLGALRQSKL